MSRLSLQRHAEDVALRDQFGMKPDTIVLLPTEKGFVVELRELTYKQAQAVLAAAAETGVELNRRRLR